MGNDIRARMIDKIARIIDDDPTSWEDAKANSILDALAEETLGILPADHAPGTHPSYALGFQYGVYTVMYRLFGALPLRVEDPTP